MIFISFFLCVPLVRFSLNDVDFDFFCCLHFLFNSQMIFLLLSSLTRINTNYGSNNPKKIHIIFYIKNQTIIIIIIILYTTTKKKNNLIIINKYWFFFLSLSLSLSLSFSLFRSEYRVAMRLNIMNIMVTPRPMPRPMPRPLPCPLPPAPNDVSTMPFVTENAIESPVYYLCVPWSIQLVVHLSSEAIFVVVFYIAISDDVPQAIFHSNTHNHHWWW